MIPGVSVEVQSVPILSETLPVEYIRDISRSGISETNIQIITIISSPAFADNEMSHIRQVIMGLYGDECYHETKLSDANSNRKFLDTLGEFDSIYQTTVWST